MTQIVFLLTSKSLLKHKSPSIETLQYCSQSMQYLFECFQAGSLLYKEDASVLQILEKERRLKEDLLIRVMGGWGKGGGGRLGSFLVKGQRIQGPF